MATIKEWRKDIGELSDRDVEEFSKALTLLRQWQLFCREFSGTDNLEMIMWYELQRREVPFNGCRKEIT